MSRSRESEILERIEKKLGEIARQGNLGGGGGGGLPGAGGNASSGGLGRGGVLASRAGGKAGGGGLGGLGSLAKGALKRTAVGAAIGGVAAGAALAGEGFVSLSQGGSFTGGVSRSLLGGASSIPILGELSGAASANRVIGSTEDRINSVTNDIARFAGSEAVTPEVRKFLGEQYAEQERNVEADRKKNKAYVNNNLATIAGDQAGSSGALLGVLERIANAVEGNGGVGR